MDKEEVSAGIIPYKTSDGMVEYLLLHYPGGHWSFPKGHVEPGESHRETALRELEEETALAPDAVTVLPDFKHKFDYTYRWDRELRHKTVYYFGAEVEANLEVSLSHEHQDFDWLDYGAACERLTYDNAREMLEKFDAQLDF